MGPDRSGSARSIVDHYSASSRDALHPSRAARASLQSFVRGGLARSRDAGRAAHRRSFEGTGGASKPPSRRPRHTKRTLEAYLQAGVMPRYMERLNQIDGGTRRMRRQLERAYRTLRKACTGDAQAFERRWRATIHRWPFDEINELIREHHECYPIEAGLALDPRTRDYVRIRGRSYRRAPLSPESALAQFPARPPA